MKVLHDVKVPMRDGVRLSADIYLPAEEGSYPTVFTMTPYGTPSEENDPSSLAARFVKRGYTHVAVDVRGRNDSEGDWYPMRPQGLDGVQDEGKDGSDVISWIAKQCWSNGKVATIGYSYPGWNQHPIGREHNPHHVAMMASRAPIDPFLDMLKWNGVPTLEYTVGWALSMTEPTYSDQHEIASRYRVNPKLAMWHLPIVSLDEVLMGHHVRWWRDWLEHDSLDAYWAPIGMTGQYEKFDIPAFHHAGWYDDMIRGDLRAYAGMKQHTRNASAQVLVIGPWRHIDRNNDPKFVLRDFGPEVALDVAAMQDDWLDNIMLGKPSAGIPPVTYFLQGSNEWRQAQAWPVPGTEFTNYYLGSAGHANSLNGDGTLSTEVSGETADCYTYDPANPVPSLWNEGPIWVTPMEPTDGREIQERPDVLVYTSPPLSEPMELTGPVKALIYFSADVADTDFSVKLFEVDLGGMAYPLSFGIKSARHRNSYGKAEILVAGKIYSIEVEMQPTSNYLKPGHRLRVQVTSSDFPYFIRILNTGNNNGTTTEVRIAHTRIEHNHLYPSHIVLPIVPAGSSETAAIAKYILSNKAQP